MFKRWVVGYFTTQYAQRVEKVKGSDFVDQMRTRGKLNTGEELNYAFGLVHGEYKGLKTIGHSGGMLAFATHMVQFPEQKFTVICLCNLSGMNPSQLARQIADIYLADQFQLEPFAGEYHSDELDVTYTLVVEEGNLFFRHRTAPKAPLESTANNTFRVHNIEIDFTRNDQNQVTGFTLNSGRAKNLRFTKTV